MNIDSVGYQLMRRLSKFRLLVAIALVIVIAGTGGVVYATQHADDAVYQVAVDQKGHMRLLLLSVHLSRIILVPF